MDYAPRNDVVTVLGKTGNWYRVNYNLQTGYMHQDYLKYTTREDAELGYGWINGNGVNVRSGPGTSYSKIAVANLNDKPYIIGINDTWFKVIFGTKIGYIRSDFIDYSVLPGSDGVTPQEWCLQDFANIADFDSIYSEHLKNWQRISGL